jgi:fatty acid desaturase
MDTSGKPVRSGLSLLITLAAAWGAVMGIGCMLAGQWVCAATVLPTAAFVLYYQHQVCRWSAR